MGAAAAYVTAAYAVFVALVGLYLSLIVPRLLRTRRELAASEHPREERARS